MCEEAGEACTQDETAEGCLVQEPTEPEGGFGTGARAGHGIAKSVTPSPVPTSGHADRSKPAAGCQPSQSDYFSARPPSQGVQHPVATPRDPAFIEKRFEERDQHDADHRRNPHAQKSYRSRKQAQQVSADQKVGETVPANGAGGHNFLRPPLGHHRASAPACSDRRRQRLLPPLFTPTPVVVENGNAVLDFEGVINNTVGAPGREGSPSPQLPEQFCFSPLPRRNLDAAGRKAAAQSPLAWRCSPSTSTATISHVEHQNGHKTQAPTPRHHSVVDDVLYPFRKLLAPVLSSATSPGHSRPGSASSGKQSPAGFSSSSEEELHSTSHASSRGYTETRLRAKYGKLGRVVGRGSGGTVRLIRRNMDNKLFAVKELRQRAADEGRREYTKRLTNEFCIGSTLHHENICETLEIFEEDNKFYEIMEYCPTDLFALVQSGSLDRTSIDCLFSQILRGVAYLHSVGIAHRDLKLDNCVVSFFGPQERRACLKIIDFGCSTVFRVPWETIAHECTGVYGSDPYIPPEEFVYARYDARCADVWAAAVIYVCMSSRQFPWRVARADVDPRFHHFYTHHASSCVDTLPESARNLIYRMLEICPSERATAEEVLADQWASQIDTCCQDSSHEGGSPPKNMHWHVPITGTLE